MWKRENIVEHVNMRGRYKCGKHSRTFKNSVNGENTVNQHECVRTFLSRLITLSTFQNSVNGDKTAEQSEWRF